MSNTLRYERRKYLYKGTHDSPYVEELSDILEVHIYSIPSHKVGGHYLDKTADLS